MDDVLGALARLHDVRLRSQAAHFSNLDRGRQNSAALLAGLFHRLVTLSEPALFIEAGAFRAEASLRVRESLPATRVVAAEANPHNHAAVSDEHDFAALGIEYLHAAVAHGPEELTFMLRTRVGTEEQPAIEGNHSLLKRVDPDSTYREISVPSTTIDAIARPTEGAVCLWLDVEGASRDVLRGAEATLPRCDVMIIEVEERSWWEGQWLAVDVLGHLLEAGMTPVARDIEYENQYNVVLLGETFLRRPDVLLELELHENYLVHHMG